MKSWRTRALAGLLGVVASVGGLALAPNAPSGAELSFQTPDFPDSDVQMLDLPAYSSCVRWNDGRYTNLDHETELATQFHEYGDTGEGIDASRALSQNPLPALTDPHTPADPSAPTPTDPVVADFDGDGSPNIATLADLVKPGTKVAECAASVPCGSAAVKALASAGVKLTPVTYATEVTQALVDVETGNVDAALVFSDFADAATVRKLFRSDLVVMLNGRHDGLSPTVVPDESVGINQAVADAAGKGVKSAGLVTGRASSLVEQARIEHYRKAFEQHGIELVRVVQGDYSYESGHEAAATLTGWDCPDAVFCTSDAMAMGILDVCRADFPLETAQ